MNPAYWLALLDRAVKTAAQAAILVIGAGQVDALAVDWRLVAGFALGGCVLSVLTSLATSGIRGNGPSATTERVVRTTTRRVPTERGQVDAAYLLKVIVLALVAVLIVAVLFGAVPLDV